jgi:L-Ala-D/L-Glu epimerase
MILSGLDILPYSLPLKQPFRTSNAILYSREGFIVRSSDDRNNYGYGDAAPYPEAGTEDYRSALTIVKEFQSKHLHIKIDEHDLRNIYRLFQPFCDKPAARHALEQSLLDLICKRLGISLPVLLQLEPVSEISVNGVLGLESSNTIHEEARILINKGFRTIKIKIGNDFDVCINAIKEIRNSFGDIRIRLDANAAWKLTEAQTCLESLEGLGIEYIEQPLPPGLESETALLRKSSSIPIALDESIRSLDLLLGAHTANALDVAVLKPMVCGGILETMRLIHTCKEYEIPVVISSTFESFVGWQACVLLAAVTGSSYAHGLATQDHYEKNVADPPFSIEKGIIGDLDRINFIIDEKISYEA